MKRRLIIAVLTAILGNFPALSANAADCVGEQCEVVFSFTGQSQQFVVPAEVSELQFEVAGAAGGGGAAGGLVTGTITNPPATLNIVVGGAGALGSGAAGGFNGGGKAGTGHGNEGSGGGASDIRTGSDLASRIVVAGGGGGQGGKIGGAGGVGGGYSAGQGVTAQAGGGRGGSQIGGGSAGYSNGGTEPTRGQLGVGGQGGSSSYAGGGGGGGGLYGGGGGGADLDTCCSDGGGAGGGSSYTNSTYVSSVVHTQGANSGDGYIKLSYTRSIEIISFTGAQLDNETVVFELQLSFFRDLEFTDFDIGQAPCFAGKLDSTPTGHLLTLAGCPDGEIAVGLKQGSLDVGIPPANLIATVNFDATAPAFSWQQGIVQADNQTILIPYLLDDGGLQASNFQFQGCSSLEILEQHLRLAGCLGGQAWVRLLAGSISDSWGNSAPESDLFQYFDFDRVGPVFSWEPGAVQADNQTILIPYLLDDGSLQANNFQLQGCSSIEILEQELKIVGCQDDQAEVILLASSIADSWGNASPAQDMVQVFEFDRIRPEIAFVRFVIDPITADHELELQLSEVVQDGYLQHLESSAGCQFSTQQVELALTISGNCGFGQHSYLFPALSLIDNWGNLGPQSDFSYSFEAIDPTPPAPVAPEPEPAPEEEPVAEAPTIEEPTGENPAVPEITDPVVEEPSADEDSSPVNPEEPSNGSSENDSGADLETTPGEGDVVEDAPQNPVTGDVPARDEDPIDSVETPAPIASDPEPIDTTPVEPTPEDSTEELPEPEDQDPVVDLPEAKEEDPAVETPASPEEQLPAEEPSETDLVEEVSTVDQELSEVREPEATAEQDPEAARPESLPEEQLPEIEEVVEPGSLDTPAVTEEDEDAVASVRVTPQSQQVLLPAEQDEQGLPIGVPWSIFGLIAMAVAGFLGYRFSGK